MERQIQDKLREWASTYNAPQYFTEDPIAFPRRYADLMKKGQACLQDVEIAALMAGHLAWGRRSMIVRDTERLMTQMNHKPYEYVMEGVWRDEPTSLHRTIKWCDIARIMSRLRDIYRHCDSIEQMSITEIRCDIFGAKPDKKAANKKINMIRRWMVRDDGIVDLGLWKNSSKKNLLIPLDVHVHRSAMELGLTSRNSTDINTVMEITAAMEEVFPGDPCLGDFALFGHGVSRSGEREETIKHKL